MKRIILLCSGGMSTGILLSKMEEYAKKINFECEISAHGVNRAGEEGMNADVILLAPQVRFVADEVRAQCPDAIVEVVDMMDYGTMNGEKVIKHIINILDEK